jgi:hypothetical protein
MNTAQIDNFEKLKAQLDSLHQELSLLAKKSPNDAVNPFKIKFVNTTLSECNSFFGARYRPFSDFDQFSTDDMPSNSDVTFILGQYIECAEKLRADNIERNILGFWAWKNSDKGEPIRTAEPKRINNR